MNTRIFWMRVFFAAPGGAQLEGKARQGWLLKKEESEAELSWPIDSRNTAFILPLNP